MKKKQLKKEIRRLREVIEAQDNQLANRLDQLIDAQQKLNEAPRLEDFEGVLKKFGAKEVQE